MSIKKHAERDCEEKQPIEAGSPFRDDFRTTCYDVSISLRCTARS